MTFLQALNRLLRSESIIRGDDDDVVLFSDTNHAATINLAKIAIQNELTHLTAFDFVPYEESQSTITMAEGTRTYILNSKFVRFIGQPVLLKEDGSGNSDNVYIYPYPGGEKDLRISIPDYQETKGGVSYFYTTGGTSKKIGVFNVPDATEAGTVYRYYYEKDVSVSTETDNIPLITESEANTFVEIAARRFKYLFSTPEVRDVLFPAGVDRDAQIESSRAVLHELLRGQEPSMRYGRSYD